MWVDKDKDLGVVILTNRVYPEGYSSRSSTGVAWYRNSAVNLIVDTIKGR